MRPTIVYMRFVKKSQLYHMLDLTIAHPLIFEIREKMIGIASLVATPEKARTWRRNMRERKLLEPDRFLARQVCPQTAETKAAVSYVVEHLKSLELSDSLEEQWRGDGKGAETESPSYACGNCSDGELR
jgi:hypothetical protein